MSGARSDFLLAAIAFRLVNDLSGHTITPITGHQYTKAGGEYMDEARALLIEKQAGRSTEFVIPPEARAKYHDEHQELVPLRRQLQKETDSYIGSVKNWSKSRRFFQTTRELHSVVKDISDSELNSLGAKEAAAEIQKARLAREAESHANRVQLPGNKSQKNQNFSGMKDIGHAKGNIETQKPPQSWNAESMNQAHANQVSYLTQERGLRYSAHQTGGQELLQPDTETDVASFYSCEEGYLESEFYPPNMTYGSQTSFSHYSTEAQYGHGQIRHDHNIQPGAIYDNGCDYY